MSQEVERKTAPGPGPAPEPPPGQAQETVDFAPSGPGEQDTQARTERTGLLGTSVGSIRVVEVLGRGGMGEVYAGYDEKLKRKVALKVLHGDLKRHAEARGRFIHEAHVLSQLDHPNICRIHDLIEGSEENFLVLEFVQGRSLRRAVHENLPRPLKLKVARQVAQVLQAAHERGIVHRDLKPENVMLTPEGEAKVLDFGLAKSLTDDAALTLGAGEAFAGGPSPGAGSGASGSQARPYDATRMGSVMGTLGYMSPEQASGEPATSASDMYSFGLLVQELFAGRPPCDPNLPMPEALERASKGETRPFADEDRDLVALVKRLKSVAPASRPSAVDVVERLRWIADRPKRRRRIGLAAAAAAVLVAVTAVAVVQAVRAHREAERATREAQTAKQVSDFLARMFESSSPGVAQGKVVTAKDILDQGAGKVEEELAGQPLVQARLMNTIGDAYRELGLYDQAEPLLRKALSTREGALAPDDPSVAESLTSLGMLLVRRGDFDAAEGLLARALAIREKTLGPDDPQVARELNNLAYLLCEKGELARAEPLYERALAICEKTLGPDAPLVAATSNNLASLHYAQGDVARAEPLFRRALAIDEKTLGPEHPSVATEIGNLGSILYQQGRLTEAEPLFRRALNADEKILGSDHPDVAIDMNNLANTLADLGRFSEAEALFGRALAINEKALGPQSPSLTGGLRRLASALCEEGRYSEAAPYCARAASIAEASLRENPKDDVAGVSLGLSLVVQGSIEQGRGNLRQARASWQRALEVLRPFAGDPEKPGATEAFVRALLFLGRLEEARPIALRLMESGRSKKEFQGLCRKSGIVPQGSTAGKSK